MRTRLNRIDFAILAALQKDARLSNKELAAKVGLAPSSCLERVRRLREGGVLTGFRAEVEPRALGIAIQALVFVRLARHAREQVRSFRKHALSLREAIGVYHVAGQHDFLVHVGVRDANHLRDLAMDAFTSRPEVARIETHLIFEHVPRAVMPVLTETEDDEQRGRVVPGSTGERR
ncbi:MAG: Lrp/AsnC family transcriptional regulator [Acidobacteria bacterium]|jgi:DNA-binding Lrp family transcriptional regulator|nr:Lrp/AsnC family transcriptional regulator [Acidobacteriota bacterium]